MIQVFVNGTFDIIHRGHIELLNFARAQGDMLTVGIDSDRRVKTLKGVNRPINNQQDRKLLLSNLKSVDNVVIFDSDQDLIDLVGSHDIMVKGDDYRHSQIIGKDVCKRLIFFRRIDEYSTTETIQNIIDRGRVH